MYLTSILSMRVGYARVSTGEQDDALTQQIARLEKAGVVKIYSDIKSGRSSDRPNFNKMISLCKKGQVKEVVITRIDRLARSMITISKTIALLEELGVKLTILDAPVGDISNPFSKFSINQMGALAQFEVDLLQNRIRHGYNYFREQGKAPPQVPFGFVRRNEKYEPNLEVHESGKTYWAIAREIIDWMLETQSSVRSTIKYIRTTYNIKFSTTGFTNWLRNPALQGHIRYNAKFNSVRPEQWDVRKNTHTPLINENVYENIELLLARNKRRWGKNSKVQEVGLLAGLVYCGDCGSKCYTRKKNGLLYCKKRAVYGKDICPNKKGTLEVMVCEKLDAELAKQAAVLQNYVLSGDENEVESPEVKQLRETMEQLQRMPKNDAIDDAIAKIKIQISQISKTNAPNLELVNAWITTFSDIRFFRLMPSREKKEVYRKFVESVIISNGKVLAINLVSVD